MKDMRRFLWGLGWILAASGALAARIPDIANTPHNLSNTGPGPVTALSESRICVFCHTPHNAENAPGAPLWNRQLSGATYSTYGSSSMDAPSLDQPGGSSKLCLSCHDGTLALGAVSVLNGQENVTIDLQGTAVDGTMPEGSGANTGFTRRLGIDLANDHPISFTYDSTLAAADGELRDPALESHIANRQAGSNTRPLVPLENDRMQCVSCHDPHIRDADATLNIKFLRLNRFQKAAPGGGAFDPANDIVCLACHDKLGQAWSLSAHADQTVADEVYTDAAATLRDFPAGTPVWQAACLNCHDTHTVPGARRLLREGVDSTTVPRTAALSAIEETCYQCHSPDGGVLQGQGTAGFPVPDIKSDFLLPRRMPIASADQPAGEERHDIRDADFTEDPATLGKGNLTNRHVECTDCHNPHRLMRNQLFNGTAGTTMGTHEHDPAVQHSNLASGVLRGGWGVEPIYGSSAWGSLPIGYQVKRGDGGIGASTAASSSYLTREYQNCLKCHSDYAYDTPPFLGESGGGTPAGTNQVTRYTNQAMEFQAPAADKGEPGGNHRSWHPVIDNTGRDLAARGGASANLFLSPWNGGGGSYIGNLTMYCTDCHGSGTAPGTVEPDGGPWGPHGSGNNFLLKGNWDNQTGTGRQGDLCFKCHNYDDYANPDNTAPNQSGFRAASGGGGGGGMGGGGGGMCGLNFRSTNLHIGHARRIGRLECSWCHTMVPHGWRNKALLVDVSQEGARAPYDNGPYYLDAMLGGGGPVNWQPSGNWSAGDCGGRDWMRRSCGNPP